MGCAMPELSTVVTWRFGRRRGKVSVVPPIANSMQPATNKTKHLKDSIGFTSRFQFVINKGNGGGESGPSTNGLCRSEFECRQRRKHSESSDSPQTCWSLHSAQGDAIAVIGLQRSLSNPFGDAHLTRLASSNILRRLLCRFSECNRRSKNGRVNSDAAVYYSVWPPFALLFERPHPGSLVAVLLVCF